MTHILTRRAWLTAIAGGTAAFAGPLRAALAAPIPITVYKDPGCGCCAVWVTHMKASGFTVMVNDGPMDPVHARFKIPAELQSCHLATASTYLIEGHVPADDVKRLLTEKPAGVVGLTIPGMPQSAPGMDVKPFQPYVVLSFNAQRKTSVFARHDKA